MCVLNTVYVFEVGEFNGGTFITIPPPVYLENPVWTGSSGTSRLPIFLPCGILWFYLKVCFRGRWNQGWHFQYSTTLDWSRKSSLNRNTGTLRLPICFSGGILLYYSYLCFRGQGIQWRHFQNSTTTGWPRKSNSNRKYWNFKVTHHSLWWNFMILPIFMFSRSRNSLVTLSKLYHHWLTSKIQFEPEILELRGYPSFSLVKFHDSTYIYVFKVDKFNSDTFRIMLPPVDLENSVQTGSTETSRLPIFFSGGILWYYLCLCFRGRGIQWRHFQNYCTTNFFRKFSSNRKYWNFEVTQLSPWWNFMILPIFMFSRAINSIVTLSELYCHRLTSKIQFEPEVLELWGFPSFSLVEFYDSTYIYVFEAEKFNGHTFTFISLSRDFENQVRTGSTGTSRLPIFLELDFWGQPVVLEFWTCHNWIPRPRKHKYKWSHSIREKDG